MSCNCGCHHDKPPATGWRTFVPLIVGAVLVGALIAGAVLKNGAPSQATPVAPAGHTASESSPAR